MTIRRPAAGLVLSLIALGCTSSGSSKALSPCDLLRSSEIEQVTGDVVNSSGLRQAMSDPTSFGPGPSLCSYETNGVWGAIVVTMQRPGQQAFDVARERSKTQLNFLDTTVDGRPAFLDDGEGAVLGNDTFATIGAQNSVHFLPIARQLLPLVVGRV